MANNLKQVRDAELLVSKPLPSAASTSATSAGIAIAGRSAPIEVAANIPALPAAIVPDTKTATLTIEAAADPAFASPVTVASAVYTGTAAGVPAAELRAAVHQQYAHVRAKVAFGANTADGSASAFTLAVLA